jgi:SH3-like domain-containing protein
MRILSLLFVLLLTLSAAPAEEVRVIGNRVNLRARPDIHSEVSGQVNRGDLLQAKSITEEWVEIFPPASVEFWVHRDFVENGEVTPPRLNVRAGPSINHSVVATVERGTRVRVQGEFAEWISIEPPPESSLWITRDLVERVRPPPPVVPPAAPPRPVMRPVEPPSIRPETPPAVAPPPSPMVQRPAPIPPDDLKLIPLEGQGEPVEWTGVLRPAAFTFGRPSRYRLTQTRGHIIETIGYVRGNETQMQSLLGRSVNIVGHQYWVQGARYPVMIPERIILQ